MAVPERIYIPHVDPNGPFKQPQRGQRQALSILVGGSSTPDLLPTAGCWQRNAVLICFLEKNRPTRQIGMEASHFHTPDHKVNKLINPLFSQSIINSYYCLK